MASLTSILGAGPADRVHTAPGSTRPVAYQAAPPSPSGALPKLRTSGHAADGAGRADRPLAQDDQLPAQRVEAAFRDDLRHFLEDRDARTTARRGA